MHQNHLCLSILIILALSITSKAHEITKALKLPSPGEHCFVLALHAFCGFLLYHPAEHAHRSPLPGTNKT